MRLSGGERQRFVKAANDGAESGGVFVGGLEIDELHKTSI